MRMNERLIVSLMLAACCACQHEHRVPVDSAAADPQPPLRPYPAATWRFARQELDLTILHLSDIVIRYRGVVADRELRGPDWYPDLAPSRSRAEALALAKRIADEARRHPAAFDELAKQDSDDVASAAFGGSLGYVPASRVPAAFLDAVASMHHGEVSLPFDTAGGIHILKLDATPAEEKLAASRIVVAYLGGGSAPLRQGRTRTRSRAEALLLATRIATEAREPGADFGALVEHHTDSPDVDQKGDIGVWSTYEPESRGRALEALARLPLGGVTDPVDSVEGFQVLQRTDVTERERFSSSFVLVGFSQPSERPDAEARMNQVVRDVTADPAKFDVYRSQYCCAKPLTWSRGRGPGVAIEARLTSLAIGATADRAIEGDSGMYLLTRLEPAPEAEPATRFSTLQLPFQPDFDDVIRHLSTASLVDNVNAFRARLLKGGFASENVREQLGGLLASLSIELGTIEAVERPDAINRFWDRARQLLTSSELASLRMQVAALLQQQLMRD